MNWESWEIWLVINLRPREIQKFTAKKKQHLKVSLVYLIQFTNRVAGQSCRKPAH